MVTLAPVPAPALAALAPALAAAGSGIRTLKKVTYKQDMKNGKKSMKHIKYGFLILVLLLCLFASGKALAQDYSFSLPKEVVNIYWNEDGSASVDYVFDFHNSNGAPSIEYVDVGVKNNLFNVSNISADVDGESLSNFSTSDFQGTGGSGVAVGLGSHAIPPGKTGAVHVFIYKIKQVLYPDSQDASYASAVYAPSYFGSQYVHGTTDLTVTFHLPPGVKPEEPRWHAAPSGFPSQPVTGVDDQGRGTYTWNNPQASGSSYYEFGASFPKSYVPASAIVQPAPIKEPVVNTTSNSSGGSSGTCSFPFVIFIWIIILAFRFLSAYSPTSKTRRLEYLPPKISIEGHGIKRGLTAVEAAILLEAPLDKVLTMILFAVVKKGAGTVTSRDPLELQTTQPQPEGLQPYEIKFLKIFQINGIYQRRDALQELMVDLVQAVAQKMKGFSRTETVAYYRDIMTRAWAEVEAANTPEVKSQKYDEVMEWTMLDRDYDQRTRQVFQSGPVFVPIWWPHFDPGFGHAVSAGASIPSTSGTKGGGGGISMPTLPGSAFAAGVVTGSQHFAQSVIGNVTTFTSAVTNQTNPPPPPSSGRGWGSGGCACACAGCACACAGGGR